MGDSYFFRYACIPGVVIRLFSHSDTAAKLSLVTAECKPALSGCPAGRQGKLRGGIQTREPHGEGGANPRLPPRPICASVPLLNWVSAISARVAARHENSPFSCKSDRLRRAQGTAG